MRILIVSSDRTALHGGACNLGDAWLSDALAGGVETFGHEAVIYDLGAARTTGDRPRLRGGRGRDLAAAIARSDGVIVGGGTLFQDDQPDRVIGGLPRLCFVVSALSRLRRRPIAFFGVGLDPIERRVPRSLVGLSSARVPVVLRDARSVTRFRDYFGRQATLGGDAALLAAEAEVAPAGQSRSGGALIALNRADAAQASAPALANIARGHGEVRFLSMDQQPGIADYEFLPPEGRTILNCREWSALGWRDAAAMVRNSEVVIASRMHALYLALMSGVPAVALGEHSKVASFAAEFGVPRVGKLSEYQPGMARHASREAVDKAVRRAWASLEDVLEVMSR